MPNKMIEELVKDLEELTRKLPGLSTNRQIEELSIMAATTQWVSDRLNADLALERRLKEAR